MLTTTYSVAEDVLIAPVNASGSYCTTLSTATAWLRPFSETSPISSSLAVSSTATATRRLMRICPSLARLRVAARYIKNGTVKFPRTGCEQLLNQLFGFGSEKHDDLVDALVYLVLGVASEAIEAPRVQYV
jgi:hypothetical protein